MKAQIVRQPLIEVNPTPEEIANCFACMDNEDQARFFNQVARTCSEWDEPFVFQLQRITDNDVLNTEGRKVMREIGEYASPSHPEAFTGNTKHTSRCLRNAADDEPIFVLRAKDPTAPSVIRTWVNVNQGLQPAEKLSTALELADEMDSWRIESVIHK